MTSLLCRPRVCLQSSLVVQRFAGRKGSVAMSAGRRATVKAKATAKNYQSPPRCLRKCADQNVLASVVQQRHVSEQSLGAKCYRGKMHSVVRPDDSYKYLCWRCLALGGAATARGGAPQPAVQELRVGPNCCADCACARRVHSYITVRGTIGSSEASPCRRTRRRSCCRRTRQRISVIAPTSRNLA